MVFRIVVFLLGLSIEEVEECTKYLESYELGIVAMRIGRLNFLRRAADEQVLCIQEFRRLLC